MTAKQLADELQRMIRAGEISPDTPVVRHFCMCEEDYGWVAVKSVEVIRHDSDAMIETDKGKAKKTAAKDQRPPVSLKLV